MFKNTYCLFPKVITPLQKATCIGLGVGSLGVSVAGGLKMIQISNMNKKEREERHPKIFKIFDKMAETPDGVTNRLKSILPTMAFGVIGSAFMVTSIDQGYKLVKIVKGSTECCLIARRAFLTSMVSPVTGVIGICFLGSFVAGTECIIRGKDYFNSPSKEIWTANSMVNMLNKLFEK